MMKDKRRKNYAIIGGVILLILIVSATYAYFMVTNGTESNTPINVTSNTTDSLTFYVTKDITLTANMGNFNSTSETGKSQKDDAVATATLRANNKDDEVSKNYYLYLDITKNELTHSLSASTPELILQVKAPGASSYLTASDVASMGGTLKNLTYKSNVVDKNGEEYPGFDITGYEGLITIANNRPIEVVQGTTNNTVTESWEVRVVFVNYNNNQTNNGGKTVNAKLMMQSEKEIRPVMMSARYAKLGGQFIWNDDYSSYITKIVFEDTTTERVMDSEINGGEPFDLSKGGDGTILAYMVKGTELITEGYDSNGRSNNDTYYRTREFPSFNPYTVYIQTEGEKIILSDGQRLFNGFYNLKEIEGLELLDTSNVTLMDDMFGSCKSLTTLDLSSFDTSNVTSMDRMFAVCSSLTTLDLSSFDTSNVTNMELLFNKCNSLTTLDLSSFDTSNVTSMRWMFGECTNLTTIYVSEYNEQTKKGWSIESCEDDSPFNGNYNLVGGQGTSYDSVSKSFAHIDGGPSNPGYFTDIKDKTN